MHSSMNSIQENGGIGSPAVVIIQFPGKDHLCENNLFYNKTARRPNCTIYTPLNYLMIGLLNLKVFMYS